MPKPICRTSMFGGQLKPNIGAIGDSAVDLVQAEANIDTDGTFRIDELTGAFHGWQRFEICHGIAFPFAWMTMDIEIGWDEH
ncbi:MAG TPA: hypothetical protein VG848_08725 [Acetobacteraceae bacterium]|nr:hypothetical protein [Acetobacteraceae bacterium]